VENDRKFLFDLNIFDAPPEEEEIIIEEELPPPPPTFSEEELAMAKEISFEQGRQQGIREQQESREQFVAQFLEIIAENFSQLFASETIREKIYEKESLTLALASLDLLFPLLDEKIGHAEIHKVVEKTLTDHRKTKEISIYVPTGLKGEIESLINRLRENEHDEVMWRVMEEADLPAGGCRLEWSDGGAVRNPAKTAREIRTRIEELLGGPQPTISEIDNSVVISEDNDESAVSAPDTPAATPETDHE
jgi:flagellar assembly protein FliH